METITPLVSDHDGIILRFLGDSIMAAFGPPIPRKPEEEVRQDAINAVCCALATQERVNVHGDTVNTASRLESFDKETFDPDYFKAPCRSLIGEPTLELIGDGFHTQFVGEFQLKGKTRTIRIFRVHGRV